MKRQQRKSNAAQEVERFRHPASKLNTCKNRGQSAHDMVGEHHRAVEAMEVLLPDTQSEGATRDGLAMSKLITS